MKDVFMAAVVFSAISFAIYTITSAIRRSRSLRAVADLHSKLLDKCAGSHDLISYMESPVGRKFLESITTERANPAGRILNAVQAGLVLSLVGAAELAIRGAGFDFDGVRALLVVGSISLAVGVGFLISAGISYVLCKSWGLVNTAASSE